MPKSRLKRKITCPWCERGSVIVSDDAKGSASVVCPKCGRCYTADLGTGKRSRASPIEK